MHSLKRVSSHINHCVDKVSNKKTVLAGDFNAKVKKEEHDHVIEKYGEERRND